VIGLSWRRKERSKNEDKNRTLIVQNKLRRGVPEEEAPDVGQIPYGNGAVIGSRLNV